MRLPRLRRGQALSADALNEIIEQIERSLIISITGVSERQTPHGRVMSVMPGHSGRPAGTAAEDCSGGDVQTLGFVLGSQDSDTWSRESGNKLVRYSFSDIGWDPTNGNIVARYREDHYDKCGKLEEVTGESDWVVLIPTESCSTE